MKTSGKSLMSALATAVAVSGLSLTSFHVLADEVHEGRSARPAGNESPDAEAKEERLTSAAGAASMHFTDADGNRRQPTAEEVRELAKAFQQDLARLAGKQKGDPNVQTHPNGAVSATIAASKLVFLTVEENDEGSLSYGHTTMDDDGSVVHKPANSQPEM